MLGLFSERALVWPKSLHNIMKNLKFMTSGAAILSMLSHCKRTSELGKGHNSPENVLVLLK